AKITRSVVASDGSEQKLELLANGQQVILYGRHPSGRDYSWFGGEPGPIRHEDLPYVRESEARAFMDAALKLLITEHGYSQPAPRLKDKGNGADRGDADWNWLAGNIRDGRELHDSIASLAAKLIASGMSGGGAVNLLRALMDASTGPHDDRWEDRRD